MLSTFFFPGRLDPVLDGSKGDEDAVIAPQVPGGGLVGQAVLSDHADGQLLDAASVMALGPGQIGQIDGEVTVAAAAVMLGVSDEKINRATGACVADVVQSA